MTLRVCRVSVPVGLGRLKLFGVGHVGSALVIHSGQALCNDWKASDL